MNDVTQMLNALGRGDSRAAEQLLPLVYEELRKVAAQLIQREKPGHTLQATALVHEAYLRLLGPGPGVSWENRRHFFAAAAEAARRILVESARRKHRLKHGGGRERQDFTAADPAAPQRPEHLLALDEALTRLATENPGAAELLQISPRKANQVWAYARAWLQEELEGDDAAG